MELRYKGLLTKDFKIKDQYLVMLFIKEGRNAESYRVKGPDGKLYFLKLFSYAKLHRSALDPENNLLEIEILKNINHPNIVAYKDNGELVFDGKKYGFLVLDFIPGETLAEQISRNPISSVYDIKRIAKEVLLGLDYLHSLDEPIVHNEITPKNIMLDLSTEPARARIIDFGYARSFWNSSKTYDKNGLNLNYVAPECFNNFFSPQSDLYSIGAVMYQMLFGLPPWSRDVSKYIEDKNKAEDIVLQERKKPLTFPNLNSEIIDFDPSILEILRKALQQNPDLRFQSAKDFIQAIDGEIIIEPLEEIKTNPLGEGIKSSKANATRGRGFSAIAGMKHLKEQLQNDVIDLIEHPEEYKKHNLGLPNGMLLYGPPGCGKTFFAERFAEEAGYNFIKIISSDIASIYVHGSQEKIGKVFKDAREHAPTILYFDELDAMVPSRDKVNNQSQSGEVNEFLSQLDNIGDSGVFVIGSTNKPDLIDRAVLRAGRLEKWFYIPPPDLEARKSMFELYLKDRPLDFGINYLRLAEMTEHYVSSDIKFLIDEASRRTIKEKKNRISMETLEYVINHQKPTVPLSELKNFENIRRKIENSLDEEEKNDRPRIGFGT